MLNTGTQFTMMLGPAVPVPAPPFLSDALESAEVTHDDAGRSGFQLTFKVGRAGLIDMFDYRQLSTQLLRVSNRVVLIMTMNAFPRVLFDGIITNQQHVPSGKPGESRVVVTGEDISIMMDMAENTTEHPAQDETIIAYKLILTYGMYQMVPIVLPPFMIDPPIPLERIPVQTKETDLAYLKRIARRFGYVFYVTPGPAPLTNIAYWGPPIRAGIPQRAITVNMGSASNCESINFEYDGLKPKVVGGRVQDRFTNTAMPVQTFFAARFPLSAMPALPFNFPMIRRVETKPAGGLNFMQAFARAQGETDASTDEVVTASGRMDGARYGSILWPRRLVGVRGVGWTYDGLYYVRKVNHSIKKGEYIQSFTLTRDGSGSITPAVIP